MPREARPQDIDRGATTSLAIDDSSTRPLLENSRWFTQDHPVFHMIDENLKEHPHR